MPDERLVLAALMEFAEAVTGKMTALTVGDPEDQLRGPMEGFLQDVGRALAVRVVCTGQTRLPGRLGKPDYGVHAAGLLAGFVELKAPGTGADPARFSGHNKEQWKRFQAIPNLIYCDGNEWALYRSGQRVRPAVRLRGDVAADGRGAVGIEDAKALLGLLTDFLSWQPIIPRTVRELAALLAPLCRMLRDDVTDALKDPRSPLVELAKDWRQLLFPDAGDEQFADAYAQTVTFALLLGRSEGAEPLTLVAAEAALAAEHSLLSRALQVLTDPAAQAEIAASLDLLIRVIAQVPTEALTGESDPWLYFYEDFMAAYNPEYRKNLGVYYTPAEVVRAQVRLIDDLLTNRMGMPLGFADHDVVTLDPAVGTGTYLLGVIQHALSRVEASQGPGAVPGQATDLADRLYGFEIMVGPFAVSELRVSRALQNKGARLPVGGSHVHLTDTLESPHTTPPQLPLYLRPIAEQHARALKVKDEVPVIVCLGNPPYDRTAAAGEGNKARTGGWVRWGDDGKGTGAIFKGFLDPALAAGHGVRVHNLYNLYVYFWRWALWKVLEHRDPAGPGVVSFISASSYLDGDAFRGMREYMRRLCDEVWILDLGGEGRGTRKSENVFAIQTPVAIAVAARFGSPDKDTPAKVRYTRIDGTRAEKLEALDAIAGFSCLPWEDCPADWQAPFRPPGNGTYFRWPSLLDLFPWQQGGVKAGRTWVIAPDAETLRARWRALCNAKEDLRVKLFKDSPTGRRAHDTPCQLPPRRGLLTAIALLPKGSRFPEISRFSYRSFDRQYLYADARVLDRAAPSLWYAHSDKQLHLTSLLSQPLGRGPALTACAYLPDLDHFRGSYGAKAAIPLYRDPQADEPNVLPGLPELLAKAYRRKVTAEDLAAYVYGVLAQPAFTERYAEELTGRELRVPITKDPRLFGRVRNVGARLLWLHTFAQRFVPTGRPRGQVPKGKARCTRPVPPDAAGYPEKYEYDAGTGTLHVGNGAFAPVAPEVYEFEVSGLKVVQSWLGYRMKDPKGRRSSPLDDINPREWPSEFTTELLELLWVLERTLATYPAQEKLLSAVVKGPCFRAGEFPAVPPETRRPPERKKQNGLFDAPER